METFYRSLNIVTKPKFDNIAGKDFMALTFIDATMILERSTKTNRFSHTRDVKVASNSQYGLVPKQY